MGAGCATLPAEYQSGATLYSKGDYVKALRKYEIALNKAKNEEHRRMIQGRIDSTKSKIADRVLREATNAYKSSEPPTVHSVDRAISILQQELEYDDKMARISRELKAYKTQKKQMVEKVHSLTEQADQLISKRKFLDAVSALQKAREINPENKDLADRLNNLTTFIEKQKKAYFKQIKELLSKGNGDKANKIYEQLASLAPEDPRLKQLKSEIKAEQKQQLLRRLRNLIAHNNYYTAYLALLNSGVKGMDEELARIREEGSQYYYNKARKNFDAQEIHVAYLAAVKAKELAPNDIRIFQLHKKCQDIVQKEIQRYIAVPTFDAPANEPDAGKLFSGALISRLFKALPYGINIVEREKADAIKAKKEVDLERLGTILRADMIITGNVSLFKVDRTVTEGMASVKVKVGEEEKPNPEFNQMVRTYGKDMEKWPHKPPMTIKEDQFELVKYKKGRATLKAFGNVFLRIFDARKAAIVFAKEFSDTVERSDTFQEPVLATNIPEDPLELPSKTEIKTELRNKLVDQMTDVILKVFENREKRFLKWAKLHIKRKEYSEAVKYISQGYLYCKNSKKDNQYSKSIHNLVLDLTEGF